MKENEAERRRTEEIQRRIKVIENPEKDIGGLKLEQIDESLEQE